jgi:alkanesulfonate monooxygenase SsuD/methylene tetrahydromethanopterin reductase-like flavin-dependent oxidoreductase (luciferase family)
MQPVRFGVAYDFRNPETSGITNHVFYDAVLDQVAWLDGLGLDLVWFTEHHFLDDGYLPSWVPVAGAMAARTGRIRFSTNICLMPFNNPVRLAEDLAVLDNISGGRVEIGIGQGYAPHEFRGFGFPVAQRVSRTEEGVEVLKRCFSGERFSFHGKRYQFDDIWIRPGYVQPGGPPLFMAAMSEAGARRAATAADGRNPDDHRIGIIRPVLVTDDATRDWPAVRAAERYRVDIYLQLSAESGGEGLARANDPDVIPQTWVIGDAEHCIAELADFISTYGITDIVTWGCPPGLHPEQMKPSLESFATKVAPALRQMFS